MTSIEWLEQEFIKLESTIGVYGKMYELLEQAKEMHQSEIEEAFYSGNQISGNWEHDSTIYYEDKFNKR